LTKTDRRFLRVGKRDLAPPWWQSSSKLTRLIGTSWRLENVALLFPNSRTLPNLTNIFGLNKYFFKQNLKEATKMDKKNSRVKIVKIEVLFGHCQSTA
jgi:hypothetical protein